MIVKEKQLSGSEHPLIAAGEKQEANVAFFLRRSFKDHTDVMVFNDLQICHNGESAQIDHLIVYPYGFILIESKSITGEVTVNSHQEWSRSWQGKWQGMASPIKQVELQTSLLKQLLIDNRATILPKFLMLQQGFGGRRWDSICAVSSHAIIERNVIPKDVSKRLVKSEFLVDKLLEIMNLKGTLSRVINVLDTRPYFNKTELVAICDFLLTHISSPEKTNIQHCCPAAEKNHLTEQPTFAQLSESHIRINCKHCSSTDKLQPNWGQYGYYVKCGNCHGNTALKQSCGLCQSKETKVSKSGNDFSLRCGVCEKTTQLLINSET